MMLAGVRCIKTGIPTSVDKCLACGKCADKNILKALLPDRPPSTGFSPSKICQCLRKCTLDMLYGVHYDFETLHNFFVGKAIHAQIQTAFPKECTEVHCEIPVGDVKVTGHVDVIHDHTLYEFKSTASTYYRIKDNSPDPMHELQAQMYYTMVREWVKDHPLVFDEQDATLKEQLPIQEIKIIYIAKTKPRKNGPTDVKDLFLEFSVEPRNVRDEIERRVNILTECFKTRVLPPAERGWLCDYCEHSERCPKEENE